MDSKEKLKRLSLQTKDRRNRMKNFVFTEKDDTANENFNDLENEVYFNINDIEKQLNFDKVKPIIMTDSDSKDLNKKGDFFNEWHEEELCKFYKSNM